MNSNDSLRLYWSQRERDFVYDGPRSCDRHLLHCFLSERRYADSTMRPNSFGESWKAFLAELESRGYDTKTLRISVKRRPAEVEKSLEEQRNLDRLRDEDRALAACVRGEAAR